MEDSDMEIDIDIENDNDLEDIRRLTAALESDAESADETTHYASNSKSFYTNTWLNASKIEAAIAFNKLTDEKYKRLEDLLQKRLLECREKQKAMVNNIKEKTTEKNNTFRYSYLGIPYFKDKNFFSPPDNDDTLIMQKSKMYNHFDTTIIRGWTVKDKREFLQLMYAMSCTIKYNKLHDVVNHDQESEVDSKEFDNKIEKFKNMFGSLNKQDLKDVALPIEQDYDWEEIAEKLHNRHSAQEYRALWRLFLHPSINKNPWSQKEHLILQDIALNHDLQDWDEIAKELNTGRSGYQCFVYYRTNMNNGHASNKWSKEEDEYLKRLVEYYKEDEYIPWGKIASLMENRTKSQIYSRWKNSSSSTLKKGRFLAEEDDVLLTCIKKFGPDFKKMTKYIAGRTLNQLRVRYNVLQKRISVVWTVAEDKKLIQLMANQTDTANYCNLVDYFPGKNRSNIRMRYSTLMKWMKANPNEDLAFAPRKRARRLVHGSAQDTLDTAIEKLNKRLHTQVKNKKCKISQFSSDNVLDDAIITTLVNERIHEEHIEKCKEDENIILDDGVISGKKLISTNLLKILILLKGNLDKQKFETSPYAKQYSELLQNNQVSLVSKIRSYSRKDKCTVITSGIDNDVNIWGKMLKGPNQYVVPPHYSTLTGCRMLLLSVADTSTHYNKSITNICRNNKYFKEEWELLLHRFKILFTWPLILSNIGPKPNIMGPNGFRGSVGHISLPSPCFMIKNVQLKYQKFKTRKQKKTGDDIDLSEHSSADNLLKMIKDGYGCITGYKNLKKRNRNHTITLEKYESVESNDDSEDSN